MKNNSLKVLNQKSANCCVSNQPENKYKVQSYFLADFKIIDDWLDKVSHDSLVFYTVSKGKSSCYVVSSRFFGGSGLGSNFYAWAVIPSRKDTAYFFESLSNKVEQFYYLDSPNKLNVSTVNFGDRFFYYRNEDSLDFKIESYTVDFSYRGIDTLDSYSSECFCK
ncbi:hypothetical protein RCC89_14165 [Cytophagaceae bacterium ABcell3]|nr:hypothetical protein RCC89_14165 [Cytophagaceae bacterium ABcell3]